MPESINVSKDFKLPKGYVFSKKGDGYKTRTYSAETNNAGKDVYIIQDGRTRIGIGIPQHVLTAVNRKLSETKDDRANARMAKQSRDYELAVAELKNQYPKFPSSEEKEALKAWKVSSGKVGRATALSLDCKVRLAITALARHRFTNYHELLSQGMSRDDARKNIERSLKEKLREWKGIEKLSNHWVPENQRYDGLLDNAVRDKKLFEVKADDGKRTWVNAVDLAKANADLKSATAHAISTTQLENGGKVMRASKSLINDVDGSTITMTKTNVPDDKWITTIEIEPLRESTENKSIKEIPKSQGNRRAGTQKRDIGKPKTKGVKGRKVQKKKHVPRRNKKQASRPSTRKARRQSR